MWTRFVWFREKGQRWALVNPVMKVGYLYNSSSSPSERLTLHMKDSGHVISCLYLYLTHTKPSEQTQFSVDCWPHWHQLQPSFSKFMAVRIPLIWMLRLYTNPGENEMTRYMGQSSSWHAKSPSWSTLTSHLTFHPTDCCVHAFPPEVLANRLSAKLPAGMWDLHCTAQHSTARFNVL
jgi:hypothetical protein